MGLSGGWSLLLLEPVFLSLVEQIRFRAAQVHDFRASVSLEGNADVNYELE